MAMGKVTIDTSLSTSQIVKDGAGLKRVLESIAASIKRAFHGKQLAGLKSELSATREAMQPIVAQLTEIENRAAGAGKNAAANFQKAQLQAQGLQNQYDALLAKITEYEAANHEKFDLGATDPHMAANAQTAEFDALAHDAAYQKMIANTETLREKQAEANATVAQLAQAATDAGGTGSAAYQNLQSDLAGLQTKAGDLNQQITDLGGNTVSVGKTIANSFGGDISKSLSRAKSAVASFAKAAATAFGVVSGAVKKLSGHLTTGNKGLSQFGNRLKSIISGALIFNLISSALRKLTEYIGGAITSTGQMRTALGNLQGAFSTAAAPILQILTPAIATLINALATVFAYIAKLVSFVTGKSISGMKSTAKAMTGVGTAAAGTAKQTEKAAKSLASFDEIERLGEKQQDTGSGGGGGSGAGITPNFDFEGKSPFLDSLLTAIEAGDWYQVGTLLGKKLNEALATIPWAEIDAKVTGWAHNLAQAMNGLIDAVDWPLLGSTFANGANVILHAIDTLAQDGNWVGLGTGLGASLNQAVTTLDWASLGRVLTDGFKVALETLYGFVTTFDFATLGSNIATMIGAAAANIDWAQAGQALSGLILGLLTALSTAIRETDWSQIGQDVLTLLQNVDWVGILSALGETIVAAVGAMWDLLQLDRFSQWVAANKEPIQDVAIVIGAFVTAWAGVNLAAIISGVVAALVTFVTTGGLAAAVTTTLGAAVAFLTSPITIVVLAVGGLIAVIALLVAHWQQVKDVAATVWAGIQAIWGVVCAWFTETIITPLGAAFTAFKALVVQVWTAMVDGVKQIWGTVTGWFSSNIIQPIINLWNTLGTAVTGIWNGIVDTIKGCINGILGFINGLISGVCNGLNAIIGLLNKLHFDIPAWVPELGGKSFGFDISTISAPQIPLLAQGAVLPANKPFLAMVGDQRNGTNIEAPLSTIQEAVAAEMQGVIDSNLAGQEAIVAKLQDLLSAVLGIRLTDEMVGRSVQRFSTQQAIRNGV